MRRFWIMVLAVLAADRLTKELSAGLTGAVTLIPGLLGLRLVHNTGIAFSLLSGYPWVLGLISLGLVALGWAVLRRFRLGPLSQSGAALVCGGALGNALDRLFLGAVTDMIEILAFRFAVFNVADIAVTAGVALLIVSILFRPEEWKRRESDG